METTKKKIPYGAIMDLLDFIEMSENEIKRELALGSQENSLTIRQAKHLRDKHLKELNSILKEYNLTVQTLV